MLLEVIDCISQRWQAGVMPSLPLLQGVPYPFSVKGTWRALNAAPLLQHIFNDCMLIQCAPFVAVATVLPLSTAGLLSGTRAVPGRPRWPSSARLHYVANINIPQYLKQLHSTAVVRYLYILYTIKHLLSLPQNGFIANVEL